MEGEAMTLSLAGEVFDVGRAKNVIVGYCFAETDSTWAPPKESLGTTYAELPRAPTRRSWAYAAYEGTRSPGDRLTVDDLLGPVLLNVVTGVGVRLLSRLLTVADEVSDVVADVRRGLCFWNLDPNEVMRRGEPQEGSDSWYLHRAWFLLNCVPGVGATISHKILHRRWPHLFPLVDTSTLDVLGRDDYWGRILDDLQRDEKEWVALEEWFRDLPRRGDEPTLTRLRLYDILLWCRQANQEDAAAKKGEALASA